MDSLSRRTLLRGSLGIAAAGALGRPYIANAAAKTATVWWTQGFIPEEDTAFRKLVADYEKASGNKINYSIVPFAALREKEVSAIATSVVPDVMEVANFEFMALNAWHDKLRDVSDIVDTQKSKFTHNALSQNHYYNNVTKHRHFYGVPMKAAAVPFHIWKSLVEKAGYRVSDIPDKWDAFLEFFAPVQTALRKKGMREVYAYGYQLTANGVDPINLYYAYLIAHGGEGLYTPDGKLHTDDPKVKEAAIKALAQLTTPFKKGYVPPVVTNWNDADDNNAFHAKLVVMDFDGTLSTELALYHNKKEYDEILVHGLPLNNEGKPIPAQVGTFGGVIPKAAKNVALATEFLKYAIEPKVLNAYLKGGLGRWVVPMESVIKSDPFWLNPKNPDMATYVHETILGPTLPVYEAYNPAVAEIDTEHVFQVAEFNVIRHGMTPEKAIETAFRRVEMIFAKYPIAQA